MVLPSAAFASSGLGIEEPAGVPSNMERARMLFGEGGTAYELADYKKAIEKFEEAYALVVQANAPQKARSRIVLNLAYAHRKEYNLSADELNLRRARELLETVLRQLERVEPTEDYTRDAIDKDSADAKTLFDEVSGLLQGALAQCARAALDRMPAAERAIGHCAERH